MGITSLQLHFFCSRQNPIPTLLQAVDSTVSFQISKVLIPWLKASTILALLSSKLLWRSCIHRNWIFGLSRCLIGAMTSVLLKAYDTCSTNPNQLLTPDMSQGLSTSKIHWSRAGPGATPSSVISNPRYSSLLFPKFSFFLFKMIPAFPHSVRYSQVLWKDSSIVSAQMMCRLHTCYDSQNLVWLCQPICVGVFLDHFPAWWEDKDLSSSLPLGLKS